MFTNAAANTGTAIVKNLKMIEIGAKNFPITTQIAVVAVVIAVPYVIDGTVSWTKSSIHQGRQIAKLTKRAYRYTADYAGSFRSAKTEAKGTEQPTNTETTEQAQAA